jgi:hypothetical protein
MELENEVLYEGIKRRTAQKLDGVSIIHRLEADNINVGEHIHGGAITRTIT